MVSALFIPSAGKEVKLEAPKHAVLAAKNQLRSTNLEAPGGTENDYNYIADKTIS